MTKFAPSTTLLAIAAVVAVACNSSEPTTGNTKDGAVAMALTNPATGTCVTAGFVLHNNSSGVNYPASTTCADGKTTIEVLLPAATYSLIVSSGPVCVPGASVVPNGSTYAGCSINAVPNFVVNEGVTTPVTVTVTLNFTGSEDQIEAMGAGTALLTLGQPVATELCGTAAACVLPDVCATVATSNTNLTGCYIPCVTTDSTVLNHGNCANPAQYCLPIAGTAGPRAGALNGPLLPFGTELGGGAGGTTAANLNGVGHVCVPLNVGGAGGAGGAGGTTG